MSLEATSEEDWLHTDVDRDNNSRLVQSYHRKCHNAFATSASPNKTTIVCEFVWLFLTVRISIMHDK